MSYRMTFGDDDLQDAGWWVSEAVRTTLPTRRANSILEAIRSLARASVSTAGADTHCRLRKEEMLRAVKECG